MAEITRKRNLNPRRPGRSYPRAVKRRRVSPYRVKTPDDHGTRHNGPPVIRIVNLANPQPAEPAGTS
jgi:hypothetical protein